MPATPKVVALRSSRCENIFYAQILYTGRAQQDRPTNKNIYAYNYSTYDGDPGFDPVRC